MSNNGAPKPVRHENHPAGWVIERGGVALCDACGFCRFAFCNGFQFFLSSLRLVSIGFIVFSVRMPSKFDISSPTLFWGVIHEVTVWRWFWHMKAAIFLQSW
jgi:hypothetical protein